MRRPAGLCLSRSPTDSDAGIRCLHAFGLQTDAAVPVHMCGQRHVALRVRLLVERREAALNECEPAVHLGEPSLGDHVARRASTSRLTVGRNCSDSPWWYASPGHCPSRARTHMIPTTRRRS